MQLLKNLVAEARTPLILEPAPPLLLSMKDLKSKLYKFGEFRLSICLNTEAMFTCSEKNGRLKPSVDPDT